jgi:hypothetical protein
MLKITLLIGSVGILIIGMRSRLDVREWSSFPVSAAALVGRSAVNVDGSTDCNLRIDYTFPVNDRSVAGSYVMHLAERCGSSLESDFIDSQVDGLRDASGSLVAHYDPSQPRRSTLFVRSDTAANCLIVGSALGIAFLLCQLLGLRLPDLVGAAVVATSGLVSSVGVFTLLIGHYRWTVEGPVLTGDSAVFSSVGLEMAVGFVALWLGQFIYVDWGLTRLHIAARDGRHDAVERILKGGARVDEIDQDGRTALMYAAGNGRLDVVGALLAGGASTVLEDRFGNTAKSYAASHPQIASKLDAAASSVSATSA